MERDRNIYMGKDRNINMEKLETCHGESSTRSRGRWKDQHIERSTWRKIDKNQLKVEVMRQTPFHWGELIYKSV